MEYTSTLKKITKIESWISKTDKKEWTKYRFEFNNGHNPFVFRTDKLNYKEGTEITYDLNQQDNKAKILTKNPSANTNVNFTNKKDDVQEYIISQSSLNRATELWGFIDKENIDLELKNIKYIASELKNFVYNGK